ncbi:hypothetical protein D9615_008272 [Tricholomella constricta]|uniref:EamA domain-containing protein n=1 Tax=Tricholomella constricta TaxID=117010 RepID=A0A8H5H3G9_9AGAR|nr:hypothetical protein D9615_008272 [Tricholomella constricta]
MSSRSVYSASTPEASDFPVARTAGASQESMVSEPPTPPELTEDASNQVGGWRARYVVVEGIVKNNVGLLLVMSAQAFFSLMNVAVKKLNSIDPPVSTFELIAVRMGITYLCSMIYMLCTKVPDPWFGPKGVRLLLVFRGFSGFFGLFGIYYSLQYLSLSDATVLTFLAPLCTGISGAIFLKENYTKNQAFASICSLFGVVLIARPVFLFGNGDSTIPQLAPTDSEKGTPEERLVAVGFALMGVLGSTGAYTSITAIGKRAHPLHAMTSFSVQSVIAASVAMFIKKTPFSIPTQVEWLSLLVMIGIFGFVAQILLTMGLQREAAGRASIAVYTQVNRAILIPSAFFSLVRYLSPSAQVIFAGILERIFFNPTPSILSVIGTVIILSAALYVVVTKDQRKKNNSSIRLSGAPDGALEEGLLDGLLAEHTEDGAPQKDCRSTQKAHTRTRGDDNDEETTALPLAQGSANIKA